MRILLVHPGCGYSVHDVWRGIDGALKGLGHEVVEYALDGRLDTAGRFLRAAWRRAGRPAEQRPTEADAKYMASSLMLERALWHEVDWVVLVSGLQVHPQALVLLRRARVRTAIVFTESPYEDDWQIVFAQLVNVCWVNERTSVERFREVQPRTWYWQHAYDPAVHQPSPPAPLPGGEGGGAPLMNQGPTTDVPAHDVVFVGSGFQERIELLEAVDWTGINLGLYGAWPLLGSRSRLRQYLRGGVTDNALTAELYRRAKIGLNMHRQSVRFGRDGPRIEGAESINPRCYELAATASFFVSDYRPELGEVFGSAVPTFETPAELERLVREYVGEEGRRRALAEEAQARVAGHTFEARVAEMIARLQEA